MQKHHFKSRKPSLRFIINYNFYPVYYCNFLITALRPDYPFYDKDWFLLEKSYF